MPCSASIPSKVLMTSLFLDLGAQKSRVFTWSFYCRYYVSFNNRKYFCITKTWPSSFLLAMVNSDKQEQKTSCLSHKCSLSVTGECILVSGTTVTPSWNSCLSYRYYLHCLLVTNFFYFFRTLCKTKLVINYSLCKYLNPVLNVVWVSKLEIFCL